jgi:hypothetical protein
LAGKFSRKDPRFIYRAANEAAHKGYQTWHRNLDDKIVNWIRKPENSRVTVQEFERFLMMFIKIRISWRVFLMLTYYLKDYL